MILRAQLATRCRVGVVLPTFEYSLASTLLVASNAARLGIDGVFAFDHLWPMGNRSRPAFAPFPILARIASLYPQLHVGTLVARVGLVSDATLVKQFATLNEIAPGRTIAAIGTGDRLNREENEAYGLTFASAHDRRTALGEVVGELTSSGITAWVGGLSEATRELARGLDVPLNLWGVGLEELEVECRRGPTTWAGVAPQGHGDLVQHFRGAASAGASWVIYGFPVDLEVLAAVSAPPSGL